MRKPCSIAFIVRDPLPPVRADLLTLFGVEMPRHGVDSELVGQSGGAGPPEWGGGGMHAVGSLGSRYASVLAPAAYVPDYSTVHLCTCQHLWTGS